MIIGSLPLIGISYQSAAKDTQYIQKLASNRTAIARIYEKAIELGFTTFAASPFPESQVTKNHIIELKSLSETHQISVIPCVGIPLGLQGKVIDVYRRWATVYQTYREINVPLSSNGSILKTFLTDPILQFRPNWKENLSIAVKDGKWYSNSEISAINLFTQEVEENLSKLEKLPIQEIEYGSELDFLFATERLDLVGELIDIARALGYEVAFGIHHAGLSLPKILAASAEAQTILTPINPLGVMMFPSRDSVVSLIKKTREKYRIIGIKCLAGGRIRPSYAFKYLHEKVDDFMVGVASISELLKAFEAARDTGLKL